MALDLIRDIKAKGYIFPSTRTIEDGPEQEPKEKTMGRLSISQVVSRNLAVPVRLNGQSVYDKTGNQVTENKLGVAEFTPHDLRRTAATCIGIMDEIIDAVLNHTKQGIIRTYNLNRYDKEKQATLESWERKLNSIITGKQGKVISIQCKAINREPIKIE